MVNLKLVEVYAVLLVLCTALIVFGLFLMQSNIASALGPGQSSYFQTVLHGIQVSAAGLIACTVLMVLFFWHLKKKYAGEFGAGKH